MSEFSFEELEEELLRNPAVRKAYEELQPEYELKRAVIEARVYRGVTQKDLAAAMGTTQSAISRMESGRFDPRTSRLIKLAGALSVQFLVSGKGIRTIPVIEGGFSSVVAQSDNVVPEAFSNTSAQEIVSYAVA